MELAPAADAEHPQVGSKINAPGNLSVIELVLGYGYHLASTFSLIPCRDVACYVSATART
jgi:hypothetical protein